MEALILVDIQNDFLPGGQLAVRKGDEIIPVVNKLQQSFSIVVATKDWHPADHKSFATNHPGKKEGDVVKVDGLGQMLWPPHCVQETIGAEFAPGLNTDKIKKIFYKGIDTDIDSYSGFYDNGHKRSTGLAEYLKKEKVTNVYIAGLTTDYCIKFTAIDAVGEGFETYVIIDGTKPVNLKEGDKGKAVEEMKSKGVKVVMSGDIKVK